MLQKYQVPHFNFPVDATNVMGLLANKTSGGPLDNRHVTTSRDPKLETLFADATSKKLKSLPQSAVNKVLHHYGFDFPRNCNFSGYEAALECAQQFFPGSVVMKISSPNALHKTDLKGVVLNVDSEAKFKEVWSSLTQAMKAAKIDDGSVQVQEQISQGVEVILGINQDPNFGPVMLFGTGGIYTEIFADTTIRVLPTSDFEAVVDETKIGQVLRGVRGEDPKAVAPLIDTMKKMQQLVLDFPEITSIDANPVMITSDRAVCVDFKILV